MSGVSYIWRADDSVEIKARARSGNRVSSLLGRIGWLYAAEPQPSMLQFSTNRHLKYMPKNEVCNFDGMSIAIVSKAKVVGIEYDTSETDMGAYLYCKIKEE